MKYSDMMGLTLESKLGKAKRFTAMTFAIILPVTVFVQTADASSGSGCDEPGADCIVVIGDPPPPPPPVWPVWGGGYGTPPGDGGSSSGGGNGSNNPSPAECLALEQSKPLNCHSDPLVNSNGFPMTMVNYSSWITSNYSDINPRRMYLNSQGYYVWGNEFNSLTYPVASNVIHQLTSTYMNTGSYEGARGGAWVALAQHCTSVHNDESARQNCLQEQADFLATLHPNPNVGGGTWSLGVTWGPITYTVGGENPSGNWVSNLFTKVQEDKICHLWYEHPDQEGCNGGN